MKTALLIGNGLNRCYEHQNPGISWYALLQNIAKTYHVDFIDQNSFPLEFECLVNSICAATGMTSDKVIEEAKTAIAKNVASIGPVADSLQHRFMQLPISEIMTTNYDYVLERAISPDAIIRSGSRERKYNLDRCSAIQKKRFYHIHGEAIKPDTLCLGFEHYAGSLAKMRDHVKNAKFADNIAHGFLPVGSSWVDLMFTHDVHIVGLALDVCEIDLWWLLTYRAFLYYLKPEIRMNLTNTITLYDTTPRSPEDAKAQQALFERLHVNYVPVKITSTFENAYRDIADMIQASLPETIKV